MSVSDMKALIVGAGRMGAGTSRTFHSELLYTHIEAYQDVGIKVIGFVDRILSRAEDAANTWSVDYASDDLAGSIQRVRPDIVSLCTPPGPDREDILRSCVGVVKGVWCEKPYSLNWLPPFPTQVNYIRRFDVRHQSMANILQGNPSSLTVIGSRDFHTIPHFTHLAQWWGSRLVYVTEHGPSTYILRIPGVKANRYKGWVEEVFTSGGVQTGFMQQALINLVESIRCQIDPISPPETAQRAEAWARKILLAGEVMYESA